MSFALRKQIKKELLDSDWAGKVEETAVTALAALLEEQHGGQLHALHGILRACISDLSVDGKITASSVQVAVGPNGGAQQVELVEFTDAFSIPRLAFDPVQRKLHLNNKPRHLYASAEAKHQVYLQRLLLIQQRLQRSRMFQQSHLLLHNTSGSGASVQLTDLQSLMGVFGRTHYVLGCISRSEDGRYVLEDTTGAVPLDLSAADTAAGYYTENCVVIAEGSLGHDGLFRVRALGLPPVEPKAALPLAAQRLNYWGGAGSGAGPDSEAQAFLALEEAQRGGADRIAVLANVWLDRQEVMDSLHTLMAGFSGVLTVPSVFVLMGNYHSRAGGGSSDVMLGGCDVDYGVMRELFGQLAALIDQYPRLKAESRFVFVPGPNDPGPGAILPQPPLPRCLTAELRRVLPTAVFASNPVRLRYATQQIVIFRHDLQRRLRRRSLLPLAGLPDAASQVSPSQSSTSQQLAAGPSPSALWGHLALTVLQQGHLVPLPLLAQPVYWQYDSALALYPLPDAVILADGTAGQEEFVHEGCRVINPGCLPGGFFAAYLPCVQQVEMSELPRSAEEADGGGGQDGGEEGAGGKDDGILGDAAATDGEVAVRQGLDGAAAPLGQPGLGARAPLQQQQKALKAAGRKSSATAAGKAPQKLPRTVRSGGGGRGRGRPAAAHLRAGDTGDGGVEVAAEAEAEEPGDEDVEVAGEPGVARRVVPERRDAALGAKGGGGGRGRGPGRGPVMPGSGVGQGTLVQAWARQLARPGREEEEEEALEDADVAGRNDMGMDGEAEEEEDIAAGVGPRRRQQRHSRKRRAIVIDDEQAVAEEERGEIAEGELEEEGGGPRGTWLDDDEDGHE